MTITQQQRPLSGAVTAEQIAENIAASNAKKANNQSAVGIDNTELVQRFREIGGRVLHRPPSSVDPKGVTFAYIERNNRVEVATALTHTADTFTKKIGTKRAIESFFADHTIFLPLNRSYRRATDMLRYL